MSAADWIILLAAVAAVIGGLIVRFRHRSHGCGGCHGCDSCNGGKDRKHCHKK